MMSRYQVTVSFLWLVAAIFFLNADLGKSENASNVKTAFAKQAMEISDLLHMFTVLIEKADKGVVSEFGLPEVTRDIPSNLETATLEQLFDRIETAAQSLRPRFLKYLKTTKIPSSSDASDDSTVSELNENQPNEYEYSSSIVDSHEGSGVSSDEETTIAFILSNADVSEFQPEYETSTIADVDDIDSSGGKSSVAFIMENAEIQEPGIAIDYIASTVAPYDMLSEAEVQESDDGSLLEEKTDEGIFSTFVPENSRSFFEEFTDEEPATESFEIPTEQLDPNKKAALNGQSEFTSATHDEEATLVLDSTEEENCETLCSTDGSHEIIMTTIKATDDSPEYILTTFSTTEDNYSDKENMENESFTEGESDEEISTISSLYDSVLNQLMSTEDFNEQVSEEYFSTTKDSSEHVGEEFQSKVKDSEEQEGEEYISATDFVEQVREHILSTTEDSDEQVSEDISSTTEDSDEQVSEDIPSTTEDSEEQIKEEFLSTTEDSEEDISKALFYSKYSKEFSKKMDPTHIESINSHPDVVGEPGKDYPNYTNIPATSFACEGRKSTGLYADIETRCQVFHVCWPHRMESYLCPAGSTFNQEILSCDYWHNSTCYLSPDHYDANLRLKDYLTQIELGLQEFANDKYPYNFEPDLTHSIFSSMKFLPVVYEFKHYSIRGRGMEPGEEIDQNKTKQMKFDLNSTLPSIEDLEHQETTDDMVDSVKDRFRELLKSVVETQNSKNSDSLDEDYDESSNDSSLYKAKLQERKHVYEKMSKSNSERSGILSKESDVETTTSKDTENRRLLYKSTHSKIGKEKIAPVIALKVLESTENVLTKGILPITRDLLAANYVKLYKTKKL